MERQLKVWPFVSVTSQRSSAADRASDRHTSDDGPAAAVMPSNAREGARQTFKDSKAEKTKNTHPHTDTHTTTKAPPRRERENPHKNSQIPKRTQSYFSRRRRRRR